MTDAEIKKFFDGMRKKAPVAPVTNTEGEYLGKMGKSISLSLKFFHEVTDPTASTTYLYCQTYESHTVLLDKKTLSTESMWVLEEGDCFECDGQVYRHSTTQSGIKQTFVKTVIVKINYGTPQRRKS